MGKSKQTISGWENATIEAESGDVKKCAQSLRCHIDDLLAPVSDPLPPCPFWTRIKKRLQRATEFDSAAPRLNSARSPRPAPARYRGEASRAFMVRQRARVVKRHSEGEW